MAATVEFVDTPHAPEGLLLSLHDLHVQRDREEPPHDVMPVAARLAIWQTLDPNDDVPRWAAVDAGQVVATSGAYLQREHDVENAFMWVYVHPERRREGLGRQVSAPMLDYLEKAGRVRLMVDIPVGRPEESLAERAGMSRVYEERTSRLFMADVDWMLMEDWIDRAAEWATEYELLAMRSPVPEEYLEPFARATRIMHTAPKEGVVEEDVDLTPGMWRDVERTQAARGSELHILVAVHRPTGSFAGYTIMDFQSLHPRQARQWDTGVDPAHRKRGLGRWLKAAMIRHAREGFPAVEYVDTENAGSNAAMLNINLAMGFRTVRVSHAYQGMLTTVRERLLV